MTDFPFSNRYGSLMLSDELLEKMEEFIKHEDRLQSLMSYLAGCLSNSKSPYEYYNLVFGGIEKLNRYFDSTESIILDHIADNADHWDYDEVVCFFIEVATDFSRLQTGSQYLQRLNYHDMLNLPYAGEFIRQAFWGGHYHDILMELINYYRWNEYFAKEIEKAAEYSENVDHKLFRIAAAMMHEGILDDIPEKSSAKLIIEADYFIKEGKYNEAVELLLKFYHQYTEVMPTEVCISIAKCYKQMNWRGLAIGWVCRSLNHAPQNEEALKLYSEMFQPDRSQLDKLTQELSGYCQDNVCLEALVLAEFLYQYHGTLLREYGAIIAGYGRAVECKLRMRFLPKLRSWIQLYGLIDTKKGKRYIKISDNRLYEDVSETKVTLGTWSLLLEQKHINRSSDEPGEFYYCIRSVYGATVSRKSISKWGQIISELKELRNMASHGSIDDWNKASRARELTFQALNGVTTTIGNIL